MTYRELPFPEWTRLQNHPSRETRVDGQIVHVPLPPDDNNAKCFVAEDGAGAIVSAVWLLTQVFMDGFWVDSAHRGTTIAYRNFKQVTTFVDSRPIPVVSCFATSPKHAELLERLGFFPLPVLTLQRLCPLQLLFPPSPPLPLQALGT